MGYRMTKKPQSMRIKKETPKVEKRTCGECKCGEWCTDSFNYKGVSFMIYCPYSTYAYSRRRDCGTCFNDTPACTKFEAGDRPNWRTKGGRV